MSPQAKISIAIDKAKEVLLKLKIKSPPVSIKQIAKHFNVPVVPYNFGSGISGALFSYKGTAAIGINPDESTKRRRFTIAHELAHFLLHDKTTKNVFIDKSILLYRDDRSSTGEEIEERQANAFAAELLMPENLVKKELRKLLGEKNHQTDERVVRELANIFEVSAIAMSFRVANLNLFL